MQHSDGTAISQAKYLLVGIMRCFLIFSLFAFYLHSIEHETLPINTNDFLQTLWWSNVLRNTDFIASLDTAQASETCVLFLVTFSPLIDSGNFTWGTAIFPLSPTTMPILIDGPVTIMDDLIDDPKRVLIAIDSQKIAHFEAVVEFAVRFKAYPTALNFHYPIIVQKEAFKIEWSGSITPARPR